MIWLVKTQLEMPEFTEMAFIAFFLEPTPEVLALGMVRLSTLAPPIWLSIRPFLLKLPLHILGGVHFTDMVTTSLMAVYVGRTKATSPQYLS